MTNDRRQVKAARVKLLRQLKAAATKYDCTVAYSAQTVYNLLRDDRTAQVSWSLQFDGKISYARTDADRYNSKRRVAVSLSRYLRRNLSLSVGVVSDQSLANLCNYLTASYIDQKPFIELLTGNAIVTAYKAENFGFGTCMEDENFVQFYADNPDKVSLLTYQNGCKGRALVWKTDQGPRVLDRIYRTDNGHTCL